MQTALLIMGPSYLQAGVYIIYWEIISLVGKSVSPVPARLYLGATLCLDAITLSLQAVGGGIAGLSFTSGSNDDTGTLIMIVSIIFQLVSAWLFLGLYSVMLSRVRKDITADRCMIMLALSAGFVIVMTIWRGFFRSVELIQGWDGYLATTEKFQIADDGLPIVLASICLNTLNPGMLLKKIKADVTLVPSQTSRSADSESGDLEKTAQTFRDKTRSFFN